MVDRGGTTQRLTSVLVGAALVLTVSGCAGASASASASGAASATPHASASASSTPDASPAGTWTATGDMIDATDATTATLLLNGMVLVTGGDGPQPDSPLTTTELYDPSTGTWTASGKTIGAAFHRTATLLRDGRVLVAGGGSDSGPLTSAELYDPISGSWSATGNMVEGHDGHLATRLLNGKVLVTGGVSVNALVSAELYDPIRGTWSATGDMIEPSGTTATLLLNGRVLVTGGYTDDSTGNGATTLASAELYDPISGTWSATAGMIAARYGHTATLLLDGRVLVAGGYTNDSTGNGATTLASAELYDPISGTWSATAGMIEARYGHTATLLLDGTVVVTGGGATDSRNNPTPILVSAERYDPGSRSWTATGGMIEARAYHTATLLLNGQALVAGSGSTPGSAELYDPGSGS